MYRAMGKWQVPTEFVHSLSLTRYVYIQYYQVIVLDSPSRSYNQQILDEGRDELAREVYT